MNIYLVGCRGCGGGFLALSFYIVVLSFSHLDPLYPSFFPFSLLRRLLRVPLSFFFLFMFFLVGGGVLLSLCGL